MQTPQKIAVVGSGLVATFCLIRVSYLYTYEKAYTNVNVNRAITSLRQKQSNLNNIHRGPQQPTSHHSSVIQMPQLFTKRQRYQQPIEQQNVELT